MWSIHLFAAAPAPVCGIQTPYIPAGHNHTLENPGVIDLVMIDVQSGEYLGEDDIVRFEDIYGCHK